MSDPQPNNIILEQAGIASTTYLRNRTAAIYLQVANNEIYAGSAICIEIDGRIFIATVAHNFNGILQGARFTLFSANRSSNTPLTIIGANYGQSENTSDLAWIELDPRSASESDLTAVSLISIESNPTFDDNSMCFATGFPVGFMTQNSNRPNHTNFVIPLLMYFTHPTGLDAATGTINLSYGRTGFNPEHGVREMPSPEGMSGGAVWLIPNRIDPIATVWNPGRLRLIGLTRTYHRSQDEIRAIAIREWLLLLRQDLPELRSTIDALFGF